MQKEPDKPLTFQEVSTAAKKRVALISSEFTNGFEFIKNYPRSVTFFGSARTNEGEPYYERAQRLASKIVERLHYSITTGGGPGIMEAANKGAYGAGGNSIGLTIELPHEQETNNYITDSVGFHYFFSRKVCLAFSAEAYIFFPGGFGTLDEFTEILTLIQTHKIPRAPIILVGEEYWRKVELFFKQELQSRNFIEEDDNTLYIITDDEEKILEIIKNAPIRLGVAYDEKADLVTEHNNHNNYTGPISQLANQHCLPCEGDMLPLSHDQSKKYLQNIDQWTLIEDREIEKTYAFKNFTEAFDFMSSIALIAEKEGHHPDIKLHDYNKVDVRISTHAISGLSENDFILAAKIDEIIR